MSKKNEPLRVKPLEESRAIAERHARAVLDVIGAPVTPQGVSSKDGPCENSDGGVSGADSYSLLHMYNVVVAPARQVEVLRRVRDAFAAQGVRVAQDEIYDIPESPGGKVSGVDEADGFRILVSSTSPPEQITVWVTSPCFANPGQGSR
ncbi:hypothetical protein B4N89_21400 [Embleya scabrispora]|uniref:Uncharacterized protein n=1 Tax=Embleya scabrispora TaxID=159449 RepID=A0A1T3P2I7_9ACTN|nr:hypothetical protein [Embleya scabrispora]OPC83152.1 hypothetical protein B4N89_21400 [Embleya scabrispora]